MRKRVKSNYKPAIFVHFVKWEEKWDEWIFIEDDTMCNCYKGCNRWSNTPNHRLALPNTQRGLIYLRHQSNHMALIGFNHLILLIIQSIIKIKHAPIIHIFIKFNYNN